MPNADLHAPLMARIYHARSLVWPGEFDFYLDLASKATARGLPVLEIACGTGRVSSRLANAGATVVAFDRSTAMLDIARQTSSTIPSVRYFEADMRDFDLSTPDDQPQSFGLVLTPGHSFMHLLTIPDQLACLGCIRRHLAPGDLFVLHLDHQDLAWLGNLGGVFEPGEELIDPLTGRLVRTSRAWSYAPSTQTAASITRWEELDDTGQLLDQWEVGPIPFHCFFRFEVEHLLRRAGFQIEALYGDFHRAELTDTSSEMIWLARAAPIPNLSIDDC
jgi:SAM-dependent methyltransferase